MAFKRWLSSDCLQVVRGARLFSKGYFQNGGIDEDGTQRWSDQVSGDQVSDDRTASKFGARENWAGEDTAAGLACHGGADGRMSCPEGCLRLRRSSLSDRGTVDSIIAAAEGGSRGLLHSIGRHTISGLRDERLTDHKEN